MSAVEELQRWFAALPRPDRREVLQFLYGGKGEVLLSEGMYLGPDPNLVQKGLFLGDRPSTIAGRCPTCGKPF